MNLEQKIIDLLNWCIFKQWDYAKRFSFRPDCLGCEMIEFCDGTKFQVAYCLFHQPTQEEKI